MGSNLAKTVDKDDMSYQEIYCTCLLELVLTSAMLWAVLHGSCQDQQNME